MAEETDIICNNCGKQTVLFCDNMFTDFFCKSCKATNLKVVGKTSQVESKHG